ncbi:formate--phosphoribosylaminoimidazolecarboxamide ligase family protein [Candidatus Woesearchaeota archaeon]|nr:formate--phosphoribosylaminoimidazolecarboxamide ligase family protein [Candidatus Woesearchaeota archaeon]
MITQEEIKEILDSYNQKNIAIGTLGGHSALDICRGAKLQGLRTIAVCQKGREKTYEQHYKTREGKGCVDYVIPVNKFSDITKESVQKELRDNNVVFIHNRYFWVYCNYKDIENKFTVPIFGTRDMVKREERNIPKNQYYFLQKAGIRMPKIFSSPRQINKLAIIKVSEAVRGYERAFFLAGSYEEYKRKSEEMIKRRVITKQALQKAVIEEYIVGAPVNFNFFYSPLTDEVELMGTDMRRQTNLDGLLRIPADEQQEVLRHVKPKFVETGHVAVTIKESLLEKAFAIGERFVRITQKLHKPGIIGPFALQGAVTAEEGKEDIVIFDVSFRIPGSPGTMFTPYSAYLYGKPISYGERIAMEIKNAVEQRKLHLLCT